MMTDPGQPTTAVERLTRFEGPDLHDLCDATEAAIEDGGGFGWLTLPPREIMESYWKGVLLVPERDLFVARLDGTIAGSAQIVRPARNNEAQRYCGWITTFFIAPWARGHGLAPLSVEALEAAACEAGLKVLNLDVRETQERAIQVYEQAGFVRWGTHPRYAFAEGRWLTGYYYSKDLTASGPAVRGPDER
jgi:RimJ/RimL family protein N-acetyltransferase